MLTLTLSGTEVTLTWTAATFNDVQSQQVRRRIPGNDQWTNFTIGVNDTSWTARPPSRGVIHLQDPSQGRQDGRKRPHEQPPSRQHSVATLPNHKHATGDAFMASPSFVPKEAVLVPPRNLTTPKTHRSAIQGINRGYDGTLNEKPGFSAPEGENGFRGEICGLAIIAPETKKVFSTYGDKPGTGP